MVTVLTESGSAEVKSARSAGEDLWLATDELEGATGWHLKAEGLCQGPVCLPMPREKANDYCNGGEVNIAAWWRLMNRPVLHTDSGDIWMLGASAGERAAALKTLDAPDFTLPDLDGKMHSLSDYRGKRVFLTTWSSW